ncbi:MAG TPA: type II toxin-antitoxin system RelE/ParE family toxin [Acidobacteriaceae bacterium]|nr:type II toxin-antitoxin system RelE/ParE family toxin [Acidobacteriaceae bacterium]
MMQLRWTEAATEDLEHIADYLFEETPLHAARIVTEIFEAPLRLLRFPALGRPGKAEGTRELVLNALPYVIIYSAGGSTIHVHRILHGAQKWP